MDSFFRSTAIVLFLAWELYWVISARKAEKEKPKTSNKQNFFDRYTVTLFGFVVMLQLLGVNILPFPQRMTLQGSGLVFMVVGFVVSVSARRTLGTNWAHAAEFQIKKHHALVTSGVYQYIRHPIYTGLLCALIGAELIAQSALVFFVIIGGFWWCYSRGKREEKILTEHFGKDYTNYIKRSKMLIPFVI